MDFSTIKALNVARVLGDALVAVHASRDGRAADTETQAVKQRIAGCYNYLAASGFDVGWNWGMWHDEIHREISAQIGDFDKHTSDGYSEQLYVYTLRSIPVRDGLPRKVLEVGSGSGMGLNFLSRLESQSTFVGADLSRGPVEYATANFARPGTLSYVQGDAENLPFTEGEFDAVINVESSHNYPNLRRFFGEVARVLKPGGYFSHVDVFTDDRYAVMTRCKQEASELEWLEDNDISEHVKASVRRRMAPNSPFRRKIRSAGFWPARLVVDWVTMQSWGACLLDEKADATANGSSKLSTWNLASRMRTYRHTLAMKPR